jgi:hypothetical protein
MIAFMPFAGLGTYPCLVYIGDTNNRESNIRQTLKYSENDMSVER